jgi:hypothetical protein
MFSFLPATYLSARQSEQFPRVILINPLTDLTATRHFDNWLFSLLALNYTKGSVMDEHAIAMAWDKYVHNLLLELD